MWLPLTTRLEIASLLGGVSRAVCSVFFLKWTRNGIEICFSSNFTGSARGFARECSDIALDTGKVKSYKNNLFIVHFPTISAFSLICLLLLTTSLSSPSSYNFSFFFFFSFFVLFLQLLFLLVLLTTSLSSCSSYSFSFLFFFLHLLCVVLLPLRTSPSSVFSSSYCSSYNILFFLELYLLVPTLLEPPVLFLNF